MQFIGDLHIHSLYSRAASCDLVPEQLAFWARKKGIGLVGSDDFIQHGVFKNSTASRWSRH